MRGNFFFGGYGAGFCFGSIGRSNSRHTLPGIVFVLVDLAPSEVVIPALFTVSFCVTVVTSCMTLAQGVIVVGSSTGNRAARLPPNLQVYCDAVYVPDSVLLDTLGLVLCKNPSETEGVTPAQAPDSSTAQASATAAVIFFIR